MLKLDDIIYVGVGGRTTAAGAGALAELLEPLGRRVVLVPISTTLHLKSQVTALPDGTVVGYLPLVDNPGQWSDLLAVPEPEGAHVVVLGHRSILMGDAAPRSAHMFRDRGLDVLELPVSEFTKMEGCVTCLSVRLHTYD